MMFESVWIALALLAFFTGYFLGIGYGKDKGRAEAARLYAQFEREDRIDIEDARAALAEAETTGTIHWEQIKKGGI